MTATLASQRYLTRSAGHRINPDDSSTPLYEVIDTVTGGVVDGGNAMYAHNECVALNREAAPSADCETCEKGCACEAGSPGCEHWGCWGGGPNAIATCVAAGPRRERLNAWLAKQGC